MSRVSESTGPIRSPSANRFSLRPPGNTLRQHTNRYPKRIVGDGAVVCKLRDRGAGQISAGVCRTGSNDIALKMLQVGMAKLVDPLSANERYRKAQHNAYSARYGLWATYVLDMPEWRRSAVDRTTGRRPQADFNLLAGRQHEISPPFLDARRQPARTDR